MVEYTNLFVLGVVYGLTVCCFSCLPYYGPYLLATGTGFRDGLVSSLIFAGGKLAVYSSLGGGAAVLGGQLNAPPGFRIAFGILLILIAMTVPLVGGKACPKARCGPVRRLSLFSLGAVSSILPCPPLAAVLVMAAARGELVSGALCGFAYGAGLLFSPMLLMGGGMALISHRIRQEVSGVLPWMQLLAMAIMVIGALKIMLSDYP